MRLRFRMMPVMLGILLTAGAIAAMPRADAQARDAVKTDPKMIWPAGLKSLEGRYMFIQVASPGGLWQVYTPNKGKRPEAVQVSINQLPEDLRERLMKAEIVLSGIQPTGVEAEERVSPSGRGKLRYYTETAVGDLVLKNLPGIGGDSGDSGSYTGKVVLRLEHQSHSNPSASGIQFLRDQQEVTWGAATIDYANLNAVPMRGEQVEDSLVIGNARVMRSGMEIFSYLEMSRDEAEGERVYRGAVRLRRVLEGEPQQ